MRDTFYLQWHERIEHHPGLKSFWTGVAIYSIPLLVIGGLYLVAIGKWQSVALALISFVIARGICSPLIALIYKKQRPYQKFGFVPPQSKFLFSAVTVRPNAFPSDHATSFASIAGVFMWFAPWLGIAIFVLAAFNGVGRIILGYHDEKDVTAGFVMGILVSLIVLWSAQHLGFTL